ncbi:MAG: hypothetical protein EXS11_04030, partial [Gemmataceae bacterium]|nr:hypothetical protein [Gemmataceae bacterium]
MSLFAARNELVTIILALIPVAVFILSNLYKAFSKANPPPGGVNPKLIPDRPQAVPRTMDLEAFLRETKRQTQGPSVPPPLNKNPNQARTPALARKDSAPIQDRQSHSQIIQAPPLPRPRQKPIARPKGGDTGPKPTPKKPEYSQPKLATNLEEMSINLALLFEQKKPRQENPVGMAIALLKKPHAGAELMVL